MTDAYILDAVRIAVRPLRRRARRRAPRRPRRARRARRSSSAPDLDPGAIDDVIFGNANGAGEDNRNVARMAALLAGLPTSVPGTTVNRLCGSSLDAAMQASRAIETGDADVVLVGGVESMSRAPWVVLKPEKGFPAGAADDALDDARLAHGQPGDAGPVDDLARREHREAGRASTASAARRRTSSRCAATSAPPPAWDAGFYDDWVVPVRPSSTRDEGIRADSSLEKLAKLKPAFVKDGTVTAGNASPLNDGAAAVLIGGEDAGQRAAGPDRRPRHVRRRPRHLRDRAGRGRQPGARSGPGSAGATSTLVELNEAFAAQSLACLGEWTELDPEKVNVNGGAIAIGHPLGASGARILGTLAYALQRDAAAR